MFLNSDNLFIAKGRLVKNPIYNVSDNGNIVTTITLAQKVPFKEGDEFKTVYIDYVAVDTKNNKIATRLAEYTTKGTLITVEGYHDSYSKKKNDSVEYIQVNKIVSFRNEEGKAVTEQRRKEGN